MNSEYNPIEKNNANQIELIKINVNPIQANERKNEN